MQTGNQHQAPAEQDWVKRIVLGLQCPQGDVHSQAAIGDIDAHMQRLPNRWGQKTQPKIMTGHRHNEQDDKRHNSQPFEGKSEKGGGVVGAGYQRNQRIDGAERMVPLAHDVHMRQRDKKGHHPEMSAVVEQGNEPLVQPG